MLSQEPAGLGAEAFNSVQSQHVEPHRPAMQALWIVVTGPNNGVQQIYRIEQVLPGGKEAPKNAVGDESGAFCGLVSLYSGPDADR